MNAEQFYEHFKDALRYLELPWGSMADAQVSIEGDRIVISYRSRVASFRVGDK